MNQSCNNRIQSTKTGQHGFTLVELMLGLLVVSISAVALYQMFVTGNEMIVEQYHRRIALEKAQSHMEEIRFYKTSMDSVPRRLAGRYTEEMIPSSEDQVGIEANYDIIINRSSEYDGRGIPIYSSVTLYYRWEERSGRQDMITLKSNF